MAVESDRPRLPPRYEPLAALGRGGGGEVWSVRDRISGATVALKLLAERASEDEVVALVREAVALSGLEGIGAPRVLAFGRLPDSDRSYLVRELVEGTSLIELAGKPGEAMRALEAVAQAADQLTKLHRAELLHGDVKPANIIVTPHGATLVDLGLAAKWGVDGAHALGMTPKYAAPELLAGGRLTIKAEIFALGRTLLEVIDRATPPLDPDLAELLRDIAARATSSDPAARPPSTDELAIPLRAALGLARSRAAEETPWPIVGIDRATDSLATMIASLPRGGGVAVAGPPGSGRTTLLRRVAWSLGVRGERVAHFDRSVVRASSAAAIAIETEGIDAAELLLLADDFDALSTEAIRAIEDLRANGARIAIVTGGGDAPIEGPTLTIFAVPALSHADAVSLVRRAIPSLSDAVVDHITGLAEHRPGRLREIVDAIAHRPVVSPEDVDRLVRDGALSAHADTSDRVVAAIRGALDRGHFDEASEWLAAVAGTVSLPLAVARSRLSTSRGDPRRAIEELAPFEDEARRVGGLDGAEWAVNAARAHLRASHYDAAIAHALDVDSWLGEAASTEAGRAMSSEANAVRGLALCLDRAGAADATARMDEAISVLELAVAVARELDRPRELSVALGSLGYVLQRAERLDAARTAYEGALAAAERAGDAGSVATTRLNLATIAKTQGALEATLTHLEAAVDMGKRSGRVSTLRHALLNLANLDLYIGRTKKAETSIAELAEQRDDLPKQLAAQLFTLEAEAADRRGDARAARELCARAAEAYEALGHATDAAEARLWGVLFSLKLPAVDRDLLRADEERAAEAMTKTSAHRVLLEFVRGKVALAGGDLAEAETAFGRALGIASDENLRDWRAKSLEGLAEVADARSEGGLAYKSRAEAVSILEGIADKLAPDLREVFWSDPWRRALRTASVFRTLASSAVGAARADAPPSTAAPAGAASGTTIASPRPLEADRLARILEITREIAGTYDLPRLLDRATDHAIALVNAERGFVILRSRRTDAEGALSVHASRGDEGGAHGRFSQSIADRVIATGEPVITQAAREDQRMSDYLSVHQLMIESIACVPIRSRSNGVIGALYVETRHARALRFESETPVLMALADQVAIAIETARLVSENEKRALDLEKANEALAAARAKLEELLDHRTQQLSATRRDLRSARAVIKGHFGYQGLVGTSDSMRRLYALIDRVKDTDIPVLVTGESGTGKEIVARAIHNAGPRGKRSFVGINCGAIPEHLLESELFGSVRGAFTGADRDRPGLFREATGGTILLDEIGEMPHKMQAGLLRVLQEKLVRPVGSAREEPVDTRVIAATHRDLHALVAAGKFREDLYYRLNVIPVAVPPLRDRIEDIPILIDHFLGIFAARYGRERGSVSRDGLKALMNYRWPGNVRQLENVLLNAWVLADAPELEIEDFGLFDAATKPATPSPAPDRGPRAPDAGRTPRSGFPASFEEHRNDEKDRILAALASANWNRVKAAEMVGMPRRTFYRRLKEYGIQ